MYSVEIACAVKHLFKNNQNKKSRGVECVGDYTKTLFRGVFGTKSLTSFAKFLPLLPCLAQVI